MKTAKGNSYNVLLNITATDKSLTLHFANLIPAVLVNATADSIAKMIPIISERIAQGTKPAGTLSKQLERIEQHRSHLLDAYTELFRCYEQMITPQSRTSPIDKARTDMLTAIPDMKMLRQMCRLSLGDTVDTYVLPDDKAALIAATVMAMKAADKPTKPAESDATTVQTP